ncbi:uncharacterized protein PITG_11613 [Phytophthora infestans T30-4]|uniref:Uncharacterized protein n=1 Tax=Phytophthora infestans (strain T30-4) TaxID=403677 RepID=D0NI58_PHYIT|nr:uncharacterized protein PITG_11613 [Phytophthora infestans T30-4]EEY59143.1 hypothetical protein PITG_11613 [Phytophthora infestans T30-4]|eukprot:XP_002901157.1 hypothetical protein PITG_11613 [Phytophthora infestans T30-4]
MYDGYCGPTPVARPRRRAHATPNRKDEDALVYKGATCNSYWNIWSCHESRSDPCDFTIPVSLRQRRAHFTK